MKILNIMSVAYRATVEEQDDTIIWLTHALRGAGANIDILLRGPAVNYLVKGQSVKPLSIGDRLQKHSPDVYGQVESLAMKKVRVFAIAEDIKQRGLIQTKRMDEARVVSRDNLGDLLSKYDQIWHW